ncbi:putative damage-inducible protein DinB [Saonia flava]|uniref:Putative damage-inducible protein DinB n=1 Tax=Saonia flava TaxID=523696 RepID=A0A846QRG7_9FLAO|nr:DinB family protein [Saonia flava]NJB69787.1 putative damage-inducible protein DinB [Saonia flava]
MDEFITEFKQNALYRMDQNTRMVTIALSKIDENDVWKRPNESSNSIGNQLLHLCGNITQYGISSLGNLKDKRERDAEFDAREGYTKEQLLDKLIETVEIAKNTIQEISDSELQRKRNVQGYYFSGIGIIIHVVEHYSYHTGQIAFWVKQLTDGGLGFYDGVDLNVTN